MPEIIDLTWNWENGTIKQALAELPEKMTKAGMESLDEGADFIVQIAKNIVHIDTGMLYKSIRKERSGKDWKIVSVRAGGYYVNPKTARLVDYATHHEWQYPYMRPAVEMARSYILNLIRQKVANEVQQH